MAYTVFDLETTIGKDLGRISNPFVDKNQVVLCGFKHKGTSCQYSEYSCDFDLTSKFLVGFNIKFDLLWLMRYKYNDFLTWIKKGGMIWDTQLVEYKLSGHDMKYPDLNTVALKYGGTTKVDLLKTWWEAGYCNKMLYENQIDIRDKNNIPYNTKQILIDYLIEDVLNTERVFLGQMPLIKNMYLILLEHMRYLLFTTLIEYNGIKIDTEQLKICINANKQEQIQQKTKVLNELKAVYPKLYNIINLDSSSQLSSILYGGDIKYQERYQRFKKDGTPFKKESVKTCYYRCDGLGLYKDPKLKSIKTDYYKVDEKALEDYKEIKLVDEILKYKKINKLFTTYFSESGGSVAGLMHPGNFIRGNYSHVATDTGRLGCRSPNMQNPEKSGSYKTIFISRFDKGILIEADFSQLEICILAMLSKDNNMQQDIKNNIDFHCKRLAFGKKMPYKTVYELSKIKKEPEWVKDRDLAKIISYQRSYGAGIKKIAATTKLSEDEIKSFIETENKLYPNVLVFNELVSAKVNNSGEYTSILGTKWSFKLFNAPEWMKEQGIEKTYSPTQIKNYPIQGTAADLVAMGAGIILNTIFKSNLDPFILPINTVHDSYLFDVHPDYIDKCKEIIKITEKKLNEKLKDIYKIEYDFIYKIDISEGRNWKECKE